MSSSRELSILRDSSNHGNLKVLTLRDQNLGSSEALDPTKFMTVVRKDENLAVRGSHMQLQLGASDFFASDKPLRG